VLAACVTPPTLRPGVVVSGTGKPAPWAGYVAMDTRATEGPLFTEVVLEDLQLRGMTVRFGAGGLELVEIPPGVYRIVDLVVSDPKRGRFHTVFWERAMAEVEFELRPGHIVHLTDVSLEPEIKDGHRGIRLQHRSPSASDVAAEVRRQFPGFADAPIECIYCSPPAADATDFARPAGKASREYGLAKVVIHYHATGGCEDCGLHAWESPEPFEQARTAPPSWLGTRDVVLAERDRLRPPDAQDDFGELWKLDRWNFLNGRVNFSILRSGRVLAKDRYFMIPDGLEAWLNEGDPAVYLSRDAAEAARGR
jgi:hypothetical protein